MTGQPQTREIVAPGDLIQFGGNQQWLVRATACEDRYALCTTLLDEAVNYTIIDWHLNVRGAMNVIGGGLGIETLSGPDEEIDEAVWMLEEGGFEVSHRNHVPLWVSGIQRAER
jgi:hypothetical protein